jgi:BASS family bile acid:Na+ symporter
MQAAFLAVCPLATLLVAESPGLRRAPRAHLPPVELADERLAVGSCPCPMAALPSAGSMVSPSPRSSGARAVLASRPAAGATQRGIIGALRLTAPPVRSLRLIANNLAPLTLLGAAVAYLYPPAFLWAKPWFASLFAVTMFALGTVLDPAELKQTLREPGRIGLGVLTQYTVMPLLAFTAAVLGGLSPELALGLVIVGSAPGAMASNVIVYLAGGALAYSIALTTVATLLSPLITPVLVKWLGGVFLPIDVWGLVKTIILTVLLPLLVGMAVRRILRTRTSLAVAWAPPVSTLAIVLICSYAVAVNQERIAQLGVQLFLLVVLVNALGYAAGWVLGGLYRFDYPRRIALTIEIGMQNAGMGVVLALAHFTPDTALPGALFAVWCILTAAAATSVLRYRRRRLWARSPS